MNEMDLKPYAIAYLEREIPRLQGMLKTLRGEKALVESGKAAPKKRYFSAASRRRMAAAQKKRWRAWRKQQVKH